MNRRDFFRRSAGVASMPVAAVVGAAIPSQAAALPSVEMVASAIVRSAPLTAQFEEDIGRYVAELDAMRIRTQRTIDAISDAGWVSAPLAQAQDRS